MSLAPALAADATSAGPQKSTTLHAETRERRYAMRDAAARFGGWSVEHDHDGDWSKLPWRATAGCSRSSLLENGTVAVRCGEAPDGSARAYFAGVRRCGSVWLCPVCTATIRAHRAIEVNQIAAAHAEAGGTLSMLTLTVRHKATDDLADLYAALRGAFTSLQQSKVWRGWRDQMVGTTVTVESTLGLAGFHVHLHVLLLWDGTLSAGARRRRLHSLRSWGGPAWAERVERRLGARPSDKRGFHVQDIPADAASYVAKIAAETTRGDYKSKDALEVMLGGVLDHDKQMCARYVEWATVMVGKRMIRFSPGLRALYIPDAPELSDQEIVDVDQGSAVVGELSEDSYRALLDNLADENGEPWAEGVTYRQRGSAAARFLRTIELTGTHPMLLAVPVAWEPVRSLVAVRVEHKRGLGWSDQRDEVAAKLQEPWTRSARVLALLGSG